MKTTLPHSTLAHRAPLSNLAKLFAGVLILTLVIMLTAIALNVGIRIAAAGQSARTTYHQDIEPHPFGPGWAADYGTASDTPYVAPDARPFGPGWAANYGVPAR